MRIPLDSREIGTATLCITVILSCIRYVSATDVDPGIELRILPLGDSITYGWGSSDGNGYRQKLQQELAGSNLLFVGSNTGGTMSNNENEGHPGADIDLISAYAKQSLPERPNIVLLMAGTNDMFESDASVQGAPDRLGALIDQVVNACPDAAVLVAQIIDNLTPGDEAKVTTYNDALPSVVKERTDAGKKVMLVDFQGKIDFEKNHADLTHPNDAGYQLMADIWFNAIKSAISKGWVQQPVGSDPTTPVAGSKGVCLSPPFWYSRGTIAAGVGHGGDGKFKPSWTESFTLAAGIGHNATGVAFGDLDGDGRADYLWVNAETGAAVAYLNQVAPDGSLILNPAAAGNAIADGGYAGSDIFFADVDGDGKVDYLIVNNGTGAVQAYLNRGPTTDGWSWNGPLDFAAGAPGANSRTLSFPDLNNDGRADYVVIGPEGSLNVWLNYGQPKFLGELAIGGQITGGQGSTDIVLADIDGDGRADYLIFDGNSALTGYLNIRTSSPAQPLWSGQGAAGSIAQGRAALSSSLVRLADIDGDGKVDYIVLNNETGGADVYYNRGSADTSVAGDGVIFTDLNGDGIDDYVWLDENANIYAYINEGNTPSGWVWNPLNNMQPIGNGAGAKREQVRFADMNGDGRSDFVIVDDKTGGIPQWYANGGIITTGPNAGQWDWNGPLGPIASGGFGVGAEVRLADINGDGRADYIVLDPYGAATVWINEALPDGGILLNLINDGKPLADGVPGARAEEILFADINGDGRADYVWVHPFNGELDVWLNELGVNPAVWVQLPSPVASGGPFSGATIHLARLTSSGRADYIPVDALTGSITPYFNGCQNQAPPPEPPVTTTPVTSSPGSSTTASGVSITTPASGTTIGGITISGVVTIGTPTVPPGVLPTCSSDALEALIPLAKQVVGAFTDSATTISSLAQAAAPSCAQVSPVVDIFVSNYIMLELLAEELANVNEGCVTGSDQTLLRSLQTGIPQLLGELGQAINLLTGMCNTQGNTPTQSAISSISSSFSSSGTIGQSESQYLQPLASYIGPDGSTDPAGVGSNGGITITGFTTIASATAPGNNLPTAGPAAISALRPQASLVATDVNNAGNAIVALAAEGSPSSGDVQAAADLFGKTFDDASSLLSGLDNIELTSFGGADVDDVADIQAQARGLRDFFAQSTKGIARYINNPAAGIPYYKSVAAAFGPSATTVAVLIAAVARINSFPNATPVVPPPITRTMTSETGSATPTEWLLLTQIGTPEKTFQDFIKTLPDGGTGQQIVYPNVNYQGYVTKLTQVELVEVLANPLVGVLQGNGDIDPDDTGTFRVASPPPSRDVDSQLLAALKSTAEDLHEHDRRDPNDFAVFSQSGSPIPLRILSLRQDTLISNVDLSQTNTQYTYEDSLGSDSFVYVLDTGFRLTHQEFQHPGLGVHTEQYVATGLIDRNGNPTTSIEDDSTLDGHGTGVAAMAVGRFFGSAKKATFVAVKYKSTGQTIPASLFDAWQWAVNDIITRGRKGKSVINLSGGFPYKNMFAQQPANPALLAGSNLPATARPDIFQQMLASAWQNDIVTVVAAGNTASDVLGDFTPQRLGTADNALITVGGISATGASWQGVSNGNPSVGPASGPLPGLDPTLVGSFSIYSVAAGLTTASKNGDDATFESAGTSLAAGTVSGMVAYWLTLFPRLAGEGYQNPLVTGDIARSMKREMINRAQMRATDGPLVAYNGVHELFCAASAQRLIRRAVPKPLSGNATSLAARQQPLYTLVEDSIYLNGQFTVDSTDGSSMFTCQPPSNGPWGFTINEYLKPLGGTGSSDVVITGGLPPSKQCGTTGTPVSGVDADSIATTNSYNLQTEPGFTICGGATSMSLTLVDEGTYTFQDSSGTSGLCYANVDGSALLSEPCTDQGTLKGYMNSVFLTCEATGNPTYCSLGT